MGVSGRGALSLHVGELRQDVPDESDPGLAVAVDPHSSTGVCSNSRCRWSANAESCARGDLTCVIRRIQLRPVGVLAGTAPRDVGLTEIG